MCLNHKDTHRLCENVRLNGGQQTEIQERTRG